MTNGYIVDTLTNVDIQKIVKLGGKVCEIYEMFTYLENFKVSALRNVIDKLSALGQKDKDENNDVMQMLVKLILNYLYREQIRKDIGESFAGKSEYWMMTKCNGRVIIYRRISYGNYFAENDRLQKTGR